MNASDTPRPVPLAPRFEVIPQELRRFTRFVLWRYEARTGRNGETVWTKVPKTLRGTNADATKAATWTTFDEARAAYGRGGFDGIGFVLTAGDPFTALDFDHCLDDSGRLGEHEAEWVGRLSSYTERSPSGTGIRVFVLGKKPAGSRSRKGPWEIYDDARFVTLTGHVWAGAPPEISERAETVAAFCAALAQTLGKPVGPVPVPPTAPMRGPLEPSDEELLARAFAARNGEAVRRLWRGDTSGHGDDPSAADLALCRHLAFWLGGDAVRVDALFRRSGLMRPKWDERRGAQTYGERTIATALDGLTDTYDPAGKSPGAVRGATVDNDPPPFVPAIARPFTGSLAAPALTGLAGEIIAALRPHTEASDVAMLGHLLTVFGVALGIGAYAEVGSTRHPARLFSLFVGPTGRGRKGTAWEAVRPIIERADDTFMPRVTGTVQSGEALVEMLRDGTGEEGKDGEVDRGVEDKRLAWIEQEFANLLSVKGRTGSTLTGIARQAWDYGDLFNTKVKNSARATRPHIGIIGHITPDELRARLDETDAYNGFLNRFLFFYSERARVLPFPEPPDGYTLTRLGDALGEAIDKARHAGAVGMNAAARAAWTRVYEPLTETGGGLVGSLQERAAPYVRRLSLIYALLDGRREVTVTDLQATLAVWRYSVASVRYVFGARTGNRVADRIRQELQAHGAMDRTALNDLFKGHRSSSDITDALNVLHANGLAVCGTVSTEGRPREVWRVAGEAERAEGDGLHVADDPDAAPECGKRGESPPASEVAPLNPPFSAPEIDVTGDGLPGTAPVFDPYDDEAEV